MLKKLKHTTTIILESQKRGKSAGSLNPEFEQAAAHMAEFQQQAKQFHTDAQTILAQLPRVFKFSSDFSSMTQKSFQPLPPEYQSMSTQLSQFTDQIQSIIGLKLAQQAQETIVKPFKDVFHRLDELETLKTEQHNSFLILESNKSKLEGLQKDPDKNYYEITTYQGKIGTRTAEVTRLETEFIATMGRLWERRFDILGPPVAAVLDLMTEIGTALRTESAPLVEKLPTELTD
jgi:chaperonin cofactor prefoldin